MQANSKSKILRRELRPFLSVNRVKGIMSNYEDDLIEGKVSTVSNESTKKKCGR